MHTTKNEKRVVQRALYWRATEQALIAAHGDDKDRASAEHQAAKKLLRESVSIVVREGESA